MTKQILTTTILLLGLFIYAPAQNRSPKEALEGLREIGVIVRYDNAEGLEPAMLPTILQMLQERARGRLMETAVPLLQSTQEVDMFGRPRLVFTVTANRPTDTGPTIRVQGSLYERVRLWRDPTKEMELATWVQSGVGIAPTVTQELLLQVFDGQVNEFIRDYREANPHPIRVEEAIANLPAQVKDDASALQGLNGIRVFVSFRPDSLADTTQRAELQKKLQSEAEKKFLDAGIPLLKWAGESDRAGSPLLYMLITLSQPNFKTHAPPIEVEGNFWQQVRPVRDLKKQTYAVTWESHDSGDFVKTGDSTSAITHNAVLKVVNRQLDEFIKAYSAANPKLSTAPNAKAQ
jgi:hypothetical protein